MEDAHGNKKQDDIVADIEPANHLHPHGRHDGGARHELIHLGPILLDGRAPCEKADHLCEVGANGDDDRAGENPAKPALDAAEKVPVEREEGAFHRPENGLIEEAGGPPDYAGGLARLGAGLEGRTSERLRILHHHDDVEEGNQQRRQHLRWNHAKFWFIRHRIFRFRMYNIQQTMCRQRRVGGDEEYRYH